jgi:hypothetical protein
MCVGITLSAVLAGWCLVSAGIQAYGNCRRDSRWQAVYLVWLSTFQLADLLLWAGTSPYPARYELQCSWAVQRVMVWSSPLLFGLTPVASAIGLWWAQRCRNWTTPLSARDWLIALGGGFACHYSMAAALAEGTPNSRCVLVGGGGFLVWHAWLVPPPLALFAFAPIAYFKWAYRQHTGTFGVILYALEMMIYGTMGILSMRFEAFSLARCILTFVVSLHVFVDYALPDDGSEPKPSPASIAPASDDDDTTFKVA